MARSRNVKPGLYKNEDLAECSIWARYIFPGLWMLADREGRLEDRPKRIKGELLPFDAVDIEPLLRELDTRGFILRYRIEGASYIQISKFSVHQSPHYSEKQSVIKPPILPESEQHMTAPISRSAAASMRTSLREQSEKQAVIKEPPKPPDSLIPDSLIPEKPLSGKPDVARRVLEHLNATCGTHYRAVEANLLPIRARIAEYGEDSLIRVIEAKATEWRGTDFEKYLRPETLFAAKKCGSYVGQLDRVNGSPEADL